MNGVVRLSIDSIAAGGDGVGRAEGLVVFVPRSAPGDVGRVRIEKAGRFARARWESIEHAGPARIEPPCRHYTVDRCGGCQLQHLAYPAQLAAKADIIRDALQRIGKRTVARPEVRASPVQWRYRRKLTLALRRAGTEGWIAGLHPYDAPGRVFDLADCPITDQRVLDVWREVRAAARFLPEERELRAAVRVQPGAGDGDASFLLEGGTHWAAHQDFFHAVPSLGALWWHPEGQSRRRLCARTGTPNGASGGATGTQADAGYARDAVARVPDAHHPDAATADASFVQVNAQVAASLHAYVVSLALAHSPTTVIDAYAGGAETAGPLASAGARVTAIELDRDAAARGATRLAPPSRMIQARVEDVLQGSLPDDVVLLNPPRTGLHERAAGILAAATPMPTLVYVSCNPATLARDVARLPRYRIASLVAFDMFPQTAHVETVCELVPESP